MVRKFLLYLSNEMIFFSILSSQKKFLFSFSIICVCLEEQTSYNTKNRSIIPWLYGMDFEKIIVEEILFAWIIHGSRNIFSHTYFPLFSYIKIIDTVCCPLMNLWERNSIDSWRSTLILIKSCIWVRSYLH